MNVKTLCKRLKTSIKTCFRTLVDNKKHIAYGAGALFLIGVMGIAYTVFSTKENPMAKKLERENNNTKNLIVNDVTELNPVKVEGIIVPHTDTEIIKAVKENNHVSIGGGRNSMGGQTASEKAVQIDMREYKKILSFSTTTKEITVQSGIRWRDIQDYIDPYNLSIKIMQTYSNFTVGGSLSVNVHGRYIGLGPIILSVKKFNIVLADGTLVTASPTENRDIFYSAIGGMGGIGVITDVTLSLADNVNVERSQTTVPTEEYYSHFKSEVRDNKKVIFHNGDMYAPNFETISAVSWVETSKEPTTVTRLIPVKKDYWQERFAWVVMSEWPKGRWIREHLIDPYLYKGAAPVHTRNYEASYDIAELEPENRTASTYVLQEYFVPVERFDEWVPKMKKVFNDNKVNVINVSIRHALPDTGAKLAWAKTESFAFVVYYKQGTDGEAKTQVKKWTQQMIDEVLSVGGTYYLPYQLLATDDQFHRAYPSAVEYFDIKKAYDPTNKFTNKLWDTYYSDEKLEYYKNQKAVTSIASTTKEYTRPYDNAYLSIPEWFIVYNSLEYARALTHSKPSKFDYFGAVRQYWNEYSLVHELTASSTHNNSNYSTVLKVIGVSYSVENIIKGVYENTIGKLTEVVSGKGKVYEDEVMAGMANDYALFIYDYPWYDFPYINYFAVLWDTTDERPIRFPQYIRKGERLFIASLEILIKTGYSKLIAYLTHQKFGVQNDIISAIISKDNGKTYELLSAPHYQPFTKLLLEELSKAANKGEELSILQIAGNQKITLSYVDALGQPLPFGVKELLRNREGFFVDNSGVVISKERVEVEVDVKNIFSLYKELRMRGISIDHFYDY